jgi:hypothetical protein
VTVLLDLNVVLDALLGREPWRAEADAIWDANPQTNATRLEPCLIVASIKNQIAGGALNVS